MAIRVEEQFGRQHAEVKVQRAPGVEREITAAQRRSTSPRARANDAATMTHSRSPGSIARRLLAALLPALFLFSACDKIAPKERAKSPNPGAPALTPEQAFSSARMKIEVGKFADAADLMRQANARPVGSSSLQDWMLFYGGFTELLTAHETDARALFTKLAERTSADKEAGQLAKFLYTAATYLSAEGPVPTKAVSAFDRSNYEVLALYLCGLKNDDVGALTDAMTFYRQFTTTPADGIEPWSGFNAHLKRLRDSVTDVCAYEELVDAATRARKASADSDIANEAAEAARTARERIKIESKLIASLDERFGDKTKAMAVDADEDAKAFPPAKEKYAALAAKFEFADARAAISEPRLKSVKRQKEQDALSIRAGYLEKFKFYLILELANSGYAKPVTLKNGTVVPGGIAKFEDTQITLRDKPAAPIPWSALDPESIFTIAKSLISASEEPDKAAFRKWHLGNFALAIGKPDEARTLLNEAAAANPQYAPEIPLLLDTPAKP